MKNDIFDAAAAAELFGVNKETMLKAFRSGEIKAVKRFRRWYVTRAALIEYVTA